MHFSKTIFARIVPGEAIVDHLGFHDPFGGLQWGALFQRERPRHEAGGTCVEHRGLYVRNGQPRPARHLHLQDVQAEGGGAQEVQHRGVRAERLADHVLLHRLLLLLPARVPDVLRSGRVREDAAGLNSTTSSAAKCIGCFP